MACCNTPQWVVDLPGCLHGWCPTRKSPQAVLAVHAGCLAIWQSQKLVPVAQGRAAKGGRAISLQCSL
jgi:hypothetical protein